MSQASEQFKATLHTAQQSLTSARRQVFNALDGQEPLDMSELVARCGGVNRASVYRTVALFERLGVLQRLQHGWKYKLELTAAFHHHHHHATCLRCGQSIALPENHEIEQGLRHLAQSQGFRLERHQLELQGVCAACQLQSPKIV